MEGMMLLQGDCLELMPYLPNASVDLVLTDPPYGTTACKWDVVIPFAPMWEQLKRIVIAKAPIVLFGSEPFSSLLRISNIKNFKYDWIWDKVLSTGHLNAKIKPMLRHEVISIFGYGKLNYFPMMEKGQPLHSEGKQRNPDKSPVYGKQNRNYLDRAGEVLKYPTTLSTKFQKVHPSKCIHSTQKPIELSEYLIKTYSNPGDTVLDFAMGSGTTGEACRKLGRAFIGIEKDPEIFAVANKRLNP